MLQIALSPAPPISQKNVAGSGTQPFAVLADNRHPVPSTSGRFQPGAIGRGRPEASIRGYAEIKVEIGKAVAEAECNTVTGLKQVHHAATPLPLS